MAVSDRVDDPAWDSFLLKTSGGHYTQSSAWAQVKALLGWRVMRILIYDCDQIAGGAQILLRSLPVIGAVGYVPGGPLFACDDPQSVRLLITQLQRIAKVYKIRYLCLQPRRIEANLEDQLMSKGYRPGSRELLAVSTLLLDLTQDIDQILKSMRKSTRHNIRLSQKRGCIVREGSEHDLQSFYRIVMESCKINKWTTFSEDYFAGLWNILYPRGYLHLFVAEHEGEAIAVSLIITFGDTVTDTMGAWNGSQAKLHPNELLEWTAITWAKSQGYRYFDFDGLAPKVASGEETPDANRDGATFFKVGFGGQPALYPPAFEYLPGRSLRWAYTALDRGRATRSWISAVERFMRGMNSG